MDDAQDQTSRHFQRCRPFHAQCPLCLTTTLNESGLFLVNQKLDPLMCHASARAFVVSLAHVSLRIPVLAAILVPRVHACMHFFWILAQSPGTYPFRWPARYAHLMRDGTRRRWTHGIDAPEHFSCTPDNCRNRCGAEVFGLVPKTAVTWGSVRAFQLVRSTPMNGLEMSLAPFKIWLCATEGWPGACGLSIGLRRRSDGAQGYFYKLSNRCPATRV